MTLRENLGTLRSGLGVEFQCPHCNSTEIIKVVKVIGKQRYRCKNFRKRFITDYTYKAYLPSINNSPKKDWAFAVRHEICQHSLFYELSQRRKDLTSKQE